MANQKVTDLTAKTTVLNTDTYHVVDTTDTSQDPAGSSYKITWASIASKILTLFTAGTGITISGGVISSDPTATQTLSNKTLASPSFTGSLTFPATTFTGTITNNGSYAGAAVVPVVNGGTGASSLTAHGVLVGNGSSTPNATSTGSTGQVLTSNGASADPTFQTPTTAQNVFSATAGQTIAPGNSVLMLPYSSSAVTLDTKLSGTGTASSLSQAFSVGANSNRALVVCNLVNGSSSEQTTGITYNGVALTKIAEVSSGASAGDRLQIWYLNAPATGNNNLVFTNSTSVQLFYNIYSYYNVNQSGQPETNATNTLNGSGSIAVTITTGGNGRTVVGAVAGNTGISAPTGSVYGFNTLTNGQLNTGDSGALYPTQTATLSATSAGGNSGAISISLVPVQPSFTPRAYLTNASIAATAILYGIAQGSAVAGGTVNVAVSGVDANQSGLTIGTQYYLSNTPGAISTSAGSVSKKVGLASDTTALMIQNI